MDQYMSLRSGHCVAEEEDWEIVDGDWWRTSFRDVPWSYVPPSDRMAKKAQQRRFWGPMFYTPSSIPAYSERRMGPSSGRRRRTCEEDNSLNVDHVGVLSALDAVMLYERNVGFYVNGVSAANLEKPDISGGVDLDVKLDEKLLAADNKKHWDGLLEELMNGPAFDSTTDSDESLEGSFIGSLSGSSELYRSTSTFSSITFSEGSIDSVGMPSTPKPRASVHDIEIKDTSPTGSISGIDYHPHLLSPTRSLNATASSFVPTFCSQLNDEPLQFPALGDKPHPSLSGPSSDSFASFTFPTLNAHNPPIKVKKDDGLFSESQGHNTASQDSGNGLLPPFLQEPSQRIRTRKSRTREIVDRLRSRLAPGDADSVPQIQQPTTLSPKYASLSPSPIGEEPTFVPPRLSVSEDGGDRVSRLSSPSCEEDDGWIDVSQPSVTSPNQKSKRARELLFALTRRRTDSLTSENLKEMMSSSQPTPSAFLPQNISPSPSYSPHSAAGQTISDGWVESSPNINVPAEGQKKMKPRTSAQNSKEANKTHNQAQHNNNNNHSRKKSSNHVSRASTSSASHSHSHSHQSQHSQFPASTTCYPQHPAAAAAAAAHSLPLPPHLVPSQTMPYFFPAYPTVSMPVPYAAFMQMPAYHLNGMPIHTNAPMQFMPMPPTTGMQPLRPGSAAMKTSMASPAPIPPMIIPPSFRAKHAQPLW